jgi:hypothetical protein
MGGQACILYGAAEFTRDVDLAVGVDPANLERLRKALHELRCEAVYFPTLSAAVLRRGHACNFRSLLPGLHRLRIDLMAKMRGVDPFNQLWKRREEIELPGVGHLTILSLPDLVKAKKTQRDKDWPMIRRLVEADIARASENPPSAKVAFWLRECRTYEYLRDLCLRYPALVRRAAARRPVLRAVIKGVSSATAQLLRKEEDEERERDRRYWAPLRAELELWRLDRPRL